jgi:hypothetical protein
MFPTYERVNAAPAESLVCSIDDAEYSSAGYDAAEIARRVGVDADALRAWGRLLGRGPVYAAIDVVRFETMARLVCSGVPVACAAALLRTAERSVTSPFPPPGGLPKPCAPGQTGSTTTRRRTPAERPCDAAPHGARPPAQD